VTGADPLDRTRAAQSAARAAIARLAASVTAADTERTISERALACLKVEGVQTTWYYDCPALVLLGSRSCASISGSDYAPADEPVGDRNLVTVDLSPLLEGAAGDYARSLCVEGGRVVGHPSAPDFAEGLEALEALHRHLVRVARPETTFGELFASLATLLASLGYENLDQRGNFGHTLTARLDERRFFEAGSPISLANAGPFTFEPHVRRTGGRWGFKREDVYACGDEGTLVAL
jgi:Xaa-Pro aminopeptidase